MLQLPLWTVTGHVTLAEPKGGGCTDPGACLAFSSESNLYQFVNANRHGKWEMQLAADRTGLIVLIADLHRAGVKTICLDRKPDGTGGEEFSLDSLMAFAGSLR